VLLNIASYVHDRFDHVATDFFVLPVSVEKAKRQFAQARRCSSSTKCFGEYQFKKCGYKLIEVPYSGMKRQSAVTNSNRFANGHLERDWTGIGASLKCPSSSSTAAPAALTTLRPPSTTST
jgi:hypothetical protein